MSTIWDWSTVADNNDDSDDSINWLEGQLPSTVNGSARAMMMRLAQYLRDQGVLTAGGTANAITITANSPITTPINGMTLAFRAASTNTGAVTLAVNGGGSKAIRKVLRGGSADVALSAGDINTKGIYVAHYDSTANTGAGAWILINPTLAFNYLPLTGGTLTGNLSISTTAPIITLNETDTPKNWYIVADAGLWTVREDSTSGANTRLTVAPGGNTTFVGSVTAASFSTSGTITSGNITSGTISATGSITSTAAITANQSFQSSTANAVLGPTGAGTVYLRPNGVGSINGQATVSSAGDLTVASRVYVNAGTSNYLDADGVTHGSGWADWGSTASKVATSLRIESRGAAYRDAAIAASTPAYAGSFFSFTWGATTTWQNTTGRICYVYATLTGGSSSVTSLGISDVNTAFVNVVSAPTAGSAGGAVTVAPGHWLRASITSSNGSVTVRIYS